jgi:formyltetrahydrofolate deformylase
VEIILLISCPDRRGIVARFTDVLYRSGANIVTLEQHLEDDGRFYMRIHADVSAAPDGGRMEAELADVARELEADMKVHDAHAHQRVAILVSKEPACLEELSNRHRAGELKCEIALVASNHDDLRPVAERDGLSFHYLPIAAGAELEQEERLLDTLRAANVDLVILARYMKVLSEKVIDAFSGRIINIHHGFLPAFKGSRPYHQAWEAGVKIIGATAHFATAELDAGPIIAQDVMPVTHQHTVSQMIRAGRDIERRVLARAVEAFLDHRIILHKGRTIIFH